MECEGIGSRLRSLEQSGGSGGGSVSGCCAVSGGFYEDGEPFVADDVGVGVSILDPNTNAWHLARGTSGIMDVRVTNPSMISSVSATIVAPVEVYGSVSALFQEPLTVQVQEPLEVYGSVSAYFDEPIQVHGLVSAHLDEPVEVFGSVSALITAPVQVYGSVSALFDQPVQVHGLVSAVLDEPVEVYGAVSAGITSLPPVVIDGPVTVVGSVSASILGTPEVIVQENIRQAILRSQDRQQTIAYADFGTVNQRVTQIDYSSATVFPGNTARKSIAYTLVGTRYRRDSITWVIL